MTTPTRDPAQVHPSLLVCLPKDILLCVFDYLSPYIRDEEERQPDLDLDEWLNRDTEEEQPNLRPLKTLSLVNKHFRTLLRPIILKNILIGNRSATWDWSRHLEKCDHTSWSKAGSTIRSMLQDVTTVPCFRAFTMDMRYRRFGEQKERYDRSVYRDDPHVYEGMVIMIELLRKAPNLRRLRLQLQPNSITTFAQIIRYTDTPAAPFRLETVTELLAPAPLLSELLEICPNVTSLGIDNKKLTELDKVYFPGEDANPHSQFYSRSIDFNTLKKPSKASNLTHFEMDSTWSKSDITRLATAFPTLAHISLRGFIGNYFCTRKMFRHVGELFTELKSLELNNITELGLGFQYPRCGTSLMADDAAGERARELLKKGRREAENRAARYAFECIESLEELWLCGSSQMIVIARRIREEETSFRDQREVEEEEEDDEAICARYDGYDGYDSEFFELMGLDDAAVSPDIQELQWPDESTVVGDRGSELPKKRVLWEWIEPWDSKLVKNKLLVLDLDGL
ncbi:hypothetical protein CC80DRAFT_506663 [Byssothecium circinans]|uniref:Uncharacterized protein n=1 Tax=Byssothecium circinans TaxID=147558 RepID=A0A6A5TPV0_9PLEO|nr:hypothetical protein CC80DRAFT_506663 [Byssothecium circinans]